MTADTDEEKAGRKVQAASMKIQALLFPYFHSLNTIDEIAAGASAVLLVAAGAMKASGCPKDKFLMMAEALFEKTEVISPAQALLLFREPKGDSC